MSSITEILEQQKSQKLQQSFQWDSRAKTFRLAEKVQVLMEIKADCGVKQCELYGVLDLNTLSLKTVQQSLFPEDLKDYYANFPKSGIMRNGNVYKATSLEHHNVEKGCMLYSTPLASETGLRKKRFTQGGLPLSLQIGGIPRVEFIEWLMTFPIGWTEVDV